MRKVPIFQLEFDVPFIERYKQGCEQILKSDQLAEGYFVKQFEERFARFIGTKHAIAVGSGTDALEVALRAVGVEKKRVIIPTNTFIATAVAAKRAGAYITLLDIENETFSLDPEALVARISSQDGAVIIVHIGGIVSKHIDKIIELCKSFEVPLIEDAAHAHGSKGAGALGDIGCFSFFPTKVMTTGEGGMITTNSDELAAKMKSIKNFGRSADPLICTLNGSNCKMTEFQALLGVLELERVMQRIKKRNLLARRYQEQLVESPYEVIATKDCSYYKQIVKTSSGQAELHHHCKERGVSLTGEVYRYPLHQQPALHYLTTNKFPVAEWFSKHHICPPLYPELELEDIDYVCGVLKEVQ